MSVPEGQRHEGKLIVHVKARELSVYTVTILSNEKVFNPEIDQEVVSRLKNCAYDIFAKAWTANSIRAETNAINRNMRYRLQEESILLCDEMLAYIGIAKSVFHLKTKRCKYWGNKVIEVRTLLQKWKESDVKRYGQPC